MFIGADSRAVAGPLVAAQYRALAHGVLVVGMYRCKTWYRRAC